MRALVWVKRTVQRLMRLRDLCEMCQGDRGGVWGNENVVDGRVLCDGCTHDYLAWKSLRIEHVNCRCVLCP